MEVGADDLNRLEEMQFLNDTVIDYYMRSGGMNCASWLRGSHKCRVAAFSAESRWKQGHVMQEAWASVLCRPPSRPPEPDLRVLGII